MSLLWEEYPPGYHCLGRQDAVMRMMAVLAVSDMSWQATVVEVLR